MTAKKKRKKKEEDPIYRWDGSEMKYLEPKQPQMRFDHFFKNNDGNRLFAVYEIVVTEAT